MICIYHSRDLDGIACGAIMLKRYLQAKMIGYDYGEDFPLVDDDYNDDIIMADVSLPIEQMLELGYNVQQRGHTFLWIDHHIGIINEYRALEDVPPLTAVLDEKLAACELCWMHLFPQTKIPPVVELLGKYDSWRNKDPYEWDNLILPFQYGMRLECTSLGTFPAVLLNTQLHTHGYLNKVMDNGASILKYQKSQNEIVCRGAFESTFEGLSAICLNTSMANSQVFESVYDSGLHDIMVPFHFKKTHWIVSLYTTHDHIDCSSIAKEWGGGGHRKAAGFQVNDITEVFPYINVKQ